MKMPFEWEKIYVQPVGIYHSYTHRAKVFGGWIVANVTLSSKQSLLSESITFVSDPRHEWEV